MTSILRYGTLQELGGKALALANLDAAELPIPPWFVVSPAAFTRSLSAAQQQILTNGNLEAVRAVLAQIEPAPDVAAEILAAAQDLTPAGARLAVRSSATEEDGSENSFAGQLASYLFVDAPSILRRVADVWRSGFSDRILEYRRNCSLPPLPSSAPAVLVQQMIDAESSGVAFSADPVSGRRSLAIVSAVFGMGTALVGGEADADVYEIDRHGSIERQTIAPKLLRHAFDPSAEEGVSAQSLSQEQRDQPVLTPPQAAEVATLARRSAAHFGRPQDIEWAIAGDKLYLLQSRPITTLRNLPDPEGNFNLWDNSNITESYNGVTTPLTFSFARAIYEGVYRQFCRILRVPERRVEASDSIFQGMLGLIRGRVYYNLLNWYRVLALLPGFTVNRSYMEQMMGVREPLPQEIVASLEHATTSERLADAFSLARMMLSLLRNNWTLEIQITRFYARLENALQEPSPPLVQMRLDELTAYYIDLEKKLLKHWDAPLINDFFAMIFHGVLRKLTAKWLNDDSGVLANDAIRGEGGIISAEPAARVRAMAGIATRDPALQQALCEAPLAEALRAARANPEFRTAYEAYLARFGDRCLEELKLESETLHENPLVLLRNVGGLASAGSSAPRHDPQQNVARQTEDKIRQHLRASPIRKALLLWVLRNARARVRQRENLRFERTRLFGRVRSIFREAGRRLEATGALENPGDIFYLEIQEILGYVDGTAVTAELKPLVAARKAEFAHYRATPAPPERFETHGPVSQIREYAARAAEQPATQPGDSADERRGIGCCQGIVRGIARVIHDPRTAYLPAGSILVADHTDPGWIMLFPAAAGLLVERGSLLSHSAIVAREMGIPAVVSVPGVTTWLRDGDLVELDGARGTVKRIHTGEPNA